jgi:hypothetical protein
MFRASFSAGITRALTTFPSRHRLARRGALARGEGGQGVPAGAIRCALSDPLLSPQRKATRRMIDVTSQEEEEDEADKEEEEEEDEAARRSKGALFAIGNTQFTQAYAN